MYFMGTDPVDRASGGIGDRPGIAVLRGTDLGGDESSLNGV